MEITTPTLAIGTELNGRFRIEQVLAQGTFCYTYVARDLSRHDACVVRELFPLGSSRLESGRIQLLATHSDEETRLRQAFVREAKSGAKLAGRGLVATRAAFSELGTAFAVRDFVPGATTLAQCGDEAARWSLEEIRTFIETLIAALARVHQAGLLHEDIRPSNILVSKDKTPYLIDFGATRQWLADAQRKHGLWVDHPFAAPECLDLIQPQGPQTDLFELAATLNAAFGSRLDQDPGLARFITESMRQQINLRPQNCETALNLVKRLTLDLDEHTPLQVFVEKSIQLSKLRYSPFECPECLGILERPNPPKTGSCPVCRAGRIVMRTIQSNQCPNCKQSPLYEKKNEPILLCPLCRDGFLKSAKRSLIKRDPIQRCTGCSAEFVPVENGLQCLQESKLPRKVPAIQSEAEWREYSGRAKQFMHCPACDAQYDVLQDGRWKQVSPPPSQKWSTLWPDEWNRIAAGLNPDAGNSECDTCGSDFYSTQDDITLTYATKDPFGFAQKYLGRLLPKNRIGFLAVGKQSPELGMVCVDCFTEYDEVPDGLRLVHSDGPLMRFAGQTHSLDSWHRLARGLPLANQLGQFSEDFDEALRTAYETGQVSFRKVSDTELLWRGRARRLRQKGESVVREPDLPFVVDSRSIQHGGMIGKLRIRLDGIQQVAVHDDILEITLPGDGPVIQLEVQPEKFQFRIEHFPRSVELRAPSLLRRMKHELSKPKR